MRQALGFVVVMVALLFSGCVTLRPTSEIQRAIGGTQMPASELRVRVRSLAGRFSGELELAAEDAAAHSSDPRFRQELTRFKMEAIPEMQAALFRADPVAALIDAWTFLVQITNWFDTIERHDEIGRALQVARTRLQNMEAEIMDLWAALAGREDIQPAAALIHQWAAAHPLGDSLATRQSTVPLLSRVTAQTGVTPLGAAAQLIEDKNDLLARLDVQIAYLPKQARWQAEYLVRSMVRDPTVLGSADARSTPLGMAARLTDVVERAPAAVAEERSEIFDAIRRERVDAFEDVDSMTKQWFTEAHDQIDALVDKVFLRAIVLIALAAAGGLLIALVATRGRAKRA